MTWSRGPRSPSNPAVEFISPSRRAEDRLPNFMLIFVVNFVESASDKVQDKVYDKSYSILRRQLKSMRLRLRHFALLLDGVRLFLVQNFDEIFYRPRSFRI